MWLIYLKLPLVENEENKIKGQKNGRYNLIIFSLGTVVVLIVIFLTAPKREAWLVLVFALILGIIGAFLMTIYNKGQSKNVKKFALIIFVLLISEGATFFITTMDYWSVKHGKRYIGTKIIFNNETFLDDSSHVLTTDSSNLYIGQTNKFIYINHMKRGTTSIYPITSIIHMDIKSKGNRSWLRRMLD
jgi:hypothetical protein